MKRTYVKVIFANDDYFETWINLPKDDAIIYYLGNVWNIGSVEDNLQKCVKVEVLKEEQ